MKSWHAVKQLIQLGLMVLFTALGLACGGKDAVGPPPPPLRASIIIGVIGGGGQTDTVTRALAQPVVAQASDSATKAAAPNAVVNWFRVAGGDTTFVGAALTDGTGQAKLQWTLLPQAGDQSVVAWVIDETGKRSAYADVHATALPDQPTSITLKSTAVTSWLDSTVTAGSLIKAVTDQFGNATTGATSFTSSSDTSWGIRADTAEAYSEGSATLQLHVGPAAVTVNATALRNMGQSTWSAIYACQLYNLPSPLPYADVVDSVGFTGIVDSIVVRAPGAGYYLRFNGQAIRRHQMGGGVYITYDTVAVGENTTHPAVLSARAQEVGRLVWDPYGAAAWDGTAYVGGDLRLCEGYVSGSIFTTQQLRLQPK